MELGSIFAGLALLAVVAFILAQPFLENQGVREQQVTRLETLQAERELVVDALRDLDFDHTMSKITTEDYTPQRAQLLERGVELLKQMDALGAAPPVNGQAAGFEAQMEHAVAARRKAAPVDPEAQMEAAVRARRAGQTRAPAAPAAERACAQCGAAATSADRFCAQCGADLVQSPACAQCGTPLKAGDRFCGKCGAKVPDAAATGAA